MDGSKFDTIVKAAATGTPRRTLLKGLGGLVATAAALVGTRGAEAARPQCPGNQTVCNAEGVEQCCPRGTSCCPVRQGNRLIGFACCQVGTQVCRRTGQGGCVAA